MPQPSAHRPSTTPSNEATQKGLRLAQEQGQSYQRALDHMTQEVAHGKKQAVGEYLVGYAIEEAEGLYILQDGQLQWKEPETENVHVEVTVCDGADGRFIPGLSVYVTLIDAAGQEIGRHQQPLLWHPVLYHYGRDWQVPGDGEYSLRIHIDTPTFPRHDKTNGKRYTQPVDVSFSHVSIKTGQKKS